MNCKRRQWRGTIAAAATILGLVLAAPTAFAQNPNPGVFPPRSTPYGKTYGEWSAAWWQWALAVPASNSPIADATGAKCGVNQSGAVWFLAGTTGGSATRACTIPGGKAILFPIINAEWSATEAQANGGVCPVPVSINGTSEAALRACADAIIDHVTIVEASVDGVTLRDLNPPNSPYRVQSPLFTFTAVQNNVFGIPQGPSASVADGYWILLAPLPAGQHTIHFRGVAPFPEFGFTFETEVTYHLTVAP